VKQQSEQGGQGFGDEGVFAGVEQVWEGVRTRAMLLLGQRGGDIPGAGQVGGEGLQDGLIEGVELCREFTVGDGEPGGGVWVGCEGHVFRGEGELDVDWGGAEASGHREALGREGLPELLWIQGEQAARSRELKAGGWGEVPRVQMHEVEKGEARKASVWWRWAIMGAG
jgi:hypothetical protein